MTFAAGVAMGRPVIRHLSKRPAPETLLAASSISTALQTAVQEQLRHPDPPPDLPSWHDGALTFNDVLSISYIRIAIFALALIFPPLHPVSPVCHRRPQGPRSRRLTQ